MGSSSDTVGSRAAAGAPNAIPPAMTDLQESHSSRPSGSAALGTRVAAGAAWMTLFKILDKSTGIVSTAILARLLVPDDFGLIVLAGSLIALLAAFGDLGLEVALLQRADADRSHFDTVWTFNVIFGIFLGVLTAAAAFPSANFYDDPRLANVMLAFALQQAIQGFENVGIVAFRKELEFKREFRFRATKRLLTTMILTIPLALFLRDYWALLGGNLGGTLLAVWLSYRVHPFRPQFSLAGLKPLLQFSKWFYLTSLINLVQSRSANLILANWADSVALGILSLSREIGEMVTREIAAPVNAAVFPAYAKIQDDRVLLHHHFLKVLSVLLLIVVPAGVGLSLLAEPIVLIFLGWKWRAAVDLLPIVSINGILGVCSASAHYVNLGTGQSRSTTIVRFANALLIVPLLFWLIPSHGALGAVMANLISSLAVLPITYVLLRQAIPLKLADLYQIIWRPATAAFAMSAVVFFIKTDDPLKQSILFLTANLAFCVIVGACVYLGVVFGLWRLAEKPAIGGEEWLLDKFHEIRTIAITMIRSIFQR